MVFEKEAMINEEGVLVTSVDEIEKSSLKNRLRSRPMASELQHIRDDKELLVP